MTEPYTAADVQLVARALIDGSSFTDAAERALSALAEAGRLVPDGDEPSRALLTIADATGKRWLCAGILGACRPESGSGAPVDVANLEGRSPRVVDVTVVLP